MTATWPGNVRELQNMAERFALTGFSTFLEQSQIIINESEFQEKSLPEVVAMVEKRVIEHELCRQNGNIDKTYKALKIPRKTLYDKFQRHNINQASFRNS